MKKVALIFSLDYELFGDGSGDVEREQIKPTDRLLDIFSAYGAKLTVMFEYGQYLAYEKFSKENTKFKDANEAIEKQLINLVKNGHDIQLHYHAQWRDAVYDAQAKQFNLNLNNVDISHLEYEEIVQVLKEGKCFLETLLKPYKPDYECVAFRAGSWAVKNEHRLVRALQASGFKLDSSVVPNARFESEYVNFEYKNSPHQYHYWYCEDDLSTSVSNGTIIELPIYTKKSPIAFLKYLNRKYTLSRKIVKTLYSQKISEVDFSLYGKIKRVLTRDYYMADINTMDYKTLIAMVEDVILNDTSTRKVIPLMFIGHSKVSYYLDDLKLFFEYLEQNYQEKLEYWNLQETVVNLESSMNAFCSIFNVTKESDLESFIPLLPILAREEYLKTRSSKYGWLVSKQCALAYFIDKRGIFSRMVFTSEVVSLDGDITIERKKLFLDNVVDFVKENKLCDFIYKAQSNVVFEVCPKGSTCVPWGTYEIDLNKTSEELFASFNAKSRNAIRKAKKEGVIVVQTQDCRLVYDNIKQTLQRQDSIHYPSLEYIKKLQKITDSVVFFVSKHNDTVQGSLILVYDDYRGYAMYAGSIQRPVTGSLDLLHYKAMEFLQQKSIPLYDFVGTRININKNSKQGGIDRFKRKFNPVLREGFAFRTVVNPIKFFMYKWSSKLYFKFRGIRYEDPISQILEESKEKEKYLLCMGPRYNQKNAQMVGGPIVLFEELIEQMDRNNIHYKIIDTNKKNYANLFTAYFCIVTSLFLMSSKAYHISLHSSRDYKALAVFVIFLSRFRGIKSSLRKFGGEAKDSFKNSKGLKRYLCQYIFSSIDKLFLETKYLVNFFKNINPNTYWFPNVRNRVLTPVMPRKFQKRFVFISHVIKEKGISEIIQAANNLDDSYTVDIYGPLMHKHYDIKDFDNTNVHYKGALSSDRVLSNLNRYDVVLLPSYKEGYPGIIIEAYSLGIPVIATNLESISEIVDNYETGILVPPKDAKKLQEAIKFFDEENYEKMSYSAYRKFDDFKSDVVTKKFIEIIDAK